MNVKEVYTSPEVEIVKFDNEDVITASPASTGSAEIGMY